jgi:hypothetical protein
MSTSTSRWIPEVRPVGRLLPLLALGLLAACAATGPSAPAPAGAQPGLPLASQGYTMMYAAVDALKWGDELLMIKVESDEVDRLVSDVAAYADELGAKLQAMSERDPVVRLDLELQPELDERRLEAVKGTRLTELLGLSGPAFERHLLLTLAGGLDQQRHLARVMIDVEQDPARKAFWLNVHERFEQLLARTTGLLERRYFRSPDEIAQSALRSS